MPYDESSGGIIALHKLAHNLASLGEKSFINTHQKREGYGGEQITDGIGTVDVRGMKLSSIILHKADFVKVDIEGGEMDGLSESEINAVKSLVSAYYVEVHPTHHGTQEDNLQTLTQRFENCGYKVDRVNFETIYCVKES